MTVVRLTILMLAISATLLGAALAYLGSPRQRWLSTSLPRIPSYISAALALLVAARGWFEAFDPAAAFVG